jgi:hypothetical protein
VALSGYGACPSSKETFRILICADAGRGSGLQPFELKLQRDVCQCERRSVTSHLTLWPIQA